MDSPFVTSYYSCNRLRLRGVWIVSWWGRWVEMALSNALLSPALLVTIPFSDRSSLASPVIGLVNHLRPRNCESIRYAHPLWLWTLSHLNVTFRFFRISPSLLPLSRTLPLPLSRTTNILSVNRVRVGNGFGRNLSLGTSVDSCAVVSLLCCNRRVWPILTP
jgi:hypothetical protein